MPKKVADATVPPRSSSPGQQKEWEQASGVSGRNSTHRKE